MASDKNPIDALKESKPPATDPFTYLTIIGEVISPQVLPTLHEILQDAKLTQEIGWDLVEILIAVEGSEQCLQTIAQLGNPRENPIDALKESKPPATDPFTYLTIIGEVISPEVLPALYEILQDAKLTQEIGWDLVEMLIAVEGSEQCLQTVAQLGNPREVIIKILEVLGDLSGDGDDTSDRTSANNPEATAAIITFVRSQTAEKRPPLPTRKSSTALDTTFGKSDASKNAPDPEAEKTDETAPSEPDLVKRLLQSFIITIIEAYVNSNNLEWASRLLEYYNPERIVARRSIMKAFKETEELLQRDALIGQLAGVARDLGLTGIQSLSLEAVFEEPLIVKLSTGGVWCLIAYWLFSSEVFETNHDQIQMTMLPDHHKLLQRFVGNEPQEQISSNQGTAEALLVMGLWLDNAKRISGQGATPADFMPYHHLLTIIAAFHPSLNSRNVANTLAGLVLHADPDDEGRLKILEDLLENCIFSALQASAVSWLREEIIIAHKTKATNAFSGPEALDSLQYLLFPSLAQLKEQDVASQWDFWAQNHPYHLQVANFLYFLFKGQDFKHLVPAGMGAAIEQRYVEPLLQTAKKLREAIDKGEIDDQGLGNEAVMQLDVLGLNLDGLSLS
ncbi:hypothetical protein BN1723_001669 [Verticillium longisporum]|uniref:DUF1760-domain-containing protein n=1 Tax=Verticillium longisporum TaxID=100787 RepID=A0A0G4KK91_VERLO|nr:hypothetical protein BN1723_001669 [Verticillium longisporum]